MDPQYRQMVDFLRSLGIEDLPHTDKSYLAHLVSVFRDLESWGCSQSVCRAGLFHSIYGTEMFQRFKLPLEQREELSGLIGPEAEFLAYCNCAMDRASFDSQIAHREEAYQIRDRISGESLELSRQQFDDLCRVHLCDWLEQVPRAKKWDYRRTAYRQMAERLGGVALTSYDRVFAVS